VDLMHRGEIHISEIVKISLWCSHTYVQIGSSREAGAVCRSSSDDSDHFRRRNDEILVEVVSLRQVVGDLPGPRLVYVGSGRS
jgi:hypothetical protein